MSDNNIEYNLHLNDHFSGPLEQAEHHAHGFHGSVMEIIEALGILELAHEAFDFLKESLSEFEAHNQAVASLTQMYKNNSDSVSMNVKELEELAETMEKTTGIHTESTMAAEQNLMKFKDIKISYEELIPVIGDFAKATKTDAADAANTLGRALENPQRAMRLLMQAGVSPEQIKSIENLQQMGKTAEAQTEIFEILKTKYQGVAKAMYEANPAEQMSIHMKEVKEDIGSLIEQLVKWLMPAVNEVFSFIHKSTAWLKEHSEGLKQVASVIGIVAAGFLLYKGALLASVAIEKIQLAIMSAKIVVFEAIAAYQIAAAASTEGLTVAQWALNVAMDANPIGIIIVALTALAAVAYLVYTHWKEITRAIGDGWESFKKVGTMLWDTMISPLQTLYHTIKSVWASISGDSKTAAIETAKATEAAMKPAKDQAEYIKWAQDLTAKNAITDKMDQMKKERGEKGEEGAKGGKGNEIHAELKPKSEAVHGQSQVTINVVVQKMIGIEKFVSTAIKGAEMAGDNILKLMDGAINQFQAEINT